jgi:MFS family permease
VSVSDATPTNLRRARWAVSLIFITNGALLANIIPRYPAITDSLGLTYLDFGLAAAAFPVGAIVFGLFAGVVIRRFGSARTAVLGTILLSLALLGAGLAPAWIFLAVALFAAGAMDAITDVAQNAQGLRLQSLFGKSILNSFHAAWSIGGVLGGAMGTAAAALNIPVGIHLAISGVLFSTLGLLTYRFLLRDPEPATAPTITSEIPAEIAAEIPAEQPAVAASSRRPWVLLPVLGLIAIAGTIIEDSGITWSTFYLTDTLNAPTSAVGLGLMAFLTAQFFGRVTGDALVNRFGQRIVTQMGASLIVVGMGVALAFPSTLGSIAGFAGAGLGVATLVPAAMHAANEIPGLRVGSGLTIVTWLMRLGFLFSPLIIGGIADAYGLRVGLLLVPVVGLIILALSPIFSGVRRPPVS